MTGISCVCPTTAARWWCLPLAIECWQRQTHVERELIVVVDGDPFVPADPSDPHGTQEHISNLVPLDQERVRYIYLQGQRTLGEKYNECIEAAGYEWVALWADDDWHAPTKLEATAALISDQVEMIGDWTYLAHDFASGATRRYVYPFKTPYVVSGTLTFRRGLGLVVPFPAKACASDDGFVREALRKGARLVQLEQPPYLYVVFSHGENTTNKRLPVEDPAWQPFDGDLATVMRGDLAKYEAAYLLRQ
jgi:glycosyltransferase involved in cell wall biosynthesis